jgi:hypothetical protein
MTRAGLGPWLLPWVVVLGAAGARGDAGPVSLQADDPALERRVADELRALGHTLDGSATGAPSVRLTRVGQHLRAVVLVPGLDAAVLEAEGAGPDTAAEFALRVVEALHARLLVARRAPVPAPVEARVVPPAARWSLGVGAWAVYSPGGVGPLPGPSFRFALEGPWGVEFTAVGPTWEGALQGVANASLRVFALGLGASVRLLDGRRGALSLGPRVLAVATDGTRQTASARFVAGAWSPALAVVTRGRLTLAGPLGLAGELALGTNLAVTEVSLGGRAVAQWGRPWLAAGLSLELCW